MAYVGSKGWYVAQLKELGITKIDGYKTETYKAHILASALKEAQTKAK